MFSLIGGIGNTGGGGTYMQTGAAGTLYWKNE
jgi:hypothetical protein